MSTIINLQMSGSAQIVEFDFDQEVVKVSEVLAKVDHTYDPENWVYCDATDVCCVHDESFLNAGSTLMIAEVGACSSINQ